MTLIKTVSVFIFWFSTGAIFYVYLLYPLAVYILSRVFTIKTQKKNIEPTVTVIITAYNEESAIKEKIRNTLDLDYPSSKMEILVASDASTDRTDQIVREHEKVGVKLIRQDQRLGKTSAQNKAVGEAKGEIILFSDATTMYESDVLRKLVPNFADDTVGCVAGRLIYRDPEDTTVGSGAKSYWNYESSLRQSESDVCSLIGTSGCLYAVRRSAYIPMYPEACSDFLIATVLYRQGLRTTYEPAAVCVEETNQESSKEFQMRVRVIAQTFTDLWRNRDMMNPFKSGFYAIELISHKLLRYCMPLFLLGLLVTSSVLMFASTFFLVIFILQVLFYLTACIGSLISKDRTSINVVSIPYYFVLANLASVVGFYKFLRGDRYASWEPIRS